MHLNRNAVSMSLLDVQEELVRLYLRLNGYFTTGLIIHSDVSGQNETQIDIVGVRFPFHSQKDRVVSCCQYLEAPDSTIDIIIGEVKSGHRRLQFNHALRDDESTISKLIDWIGAFSKNERVEAIASLRTALSPKEVNSPDNFENVLIKGVVGTFCVRPIIFSLDRPKPRPNQPKFVYGQLVLDYIWECFRPIGARVTCATNYDFDAWGPSLRTITNYFKDGAKTEVGKMRDYYQYFGFEH